MTGTFLYFAYGSNMLTERLTARCASARPAGLAVAVGHKRVWDKLSRDGSGKCGLVKAPGASVQGVLFEIALAKRPALDGFEDALGSDPGYRRDDGFAVMRAGGERCPVTTYLPLGSKRRAGLRAFEWYRALAHAGALQHGLEAAEIAAIAAVAIDPDPEPDRPTRRAALAALGAAGYRDLIEG